MRAALIITTLVALTACTSMDRRAYTEFEPLADGAFRYQSAASMIYPLDDADAEADRIAWLETYLADNHLCPQGYAITQRKPVVTEVGPFGYPAHEIYYRGHCTSGATAGLGAGQ